MSIALAHFAVGASLATVAVLYFIPELPYERVVILLSGVWAMIPDVAKLGLGSPRQATVLFDSVWANVFWFHQRLDVIDATDSVRFAAVAVGVFIGVTALAERWEYTIREHVPEETGSRGANVRSLAVLVLVLSVGSLAAGGLVLAGAFVVEAFTVLYIGTGAMLGICGLLGITTVSTQTDHETWWQHLPDWLRLPVQTAITFGVLIIAGGLTTSLRTLGQADGIYLGVALVLVVLLAILASRWS